MLRGRTSTLEPQGAAAWPPVTGPKISFENVCKRYGPLTVLDGLNMEVATGELVTIIGPSGSGKTTVLRVLMTLETIEVLQVIRQLATQHNYTMLLVTHQMGFAREVSSRVCFFDAGRFLEEGPPRGFFASPRNERTREFLNKVLEAS